MVQEYNIFAELDKEVKYYNETALDCNPSYAPTMPDLLRLIEAYWNSKFLLDEYDADNFKRLFYNIGRWRCKVSSKAIDLDVKHIVVSADLGQSFYPAWFFNGELQQWLEDNEFGKTLNEMVSKLPRYGSIVAKYVNNEILIVDPKNIIFDPTVGLEESDVIIENHDYTPAKLREEKWDADKIEDVIRYWRDNQGSQRYIKIMERYAEVPETEINPNGDPNKFVMARAILYAKDVDEKGENTGTTIDIREWKAKIYKSHNWLDKAGRGAGEGVIEETFENQIAINETSHFRHKGIFWNSLRLFASGDQLAMRNLISDARDGDLLMGEIKPINTITNDLAVYQAEMDSWSSNATNETFTHNPVSGGELKAGTPLGLGQMQAQMSGAYYAQRAEDFGMFVKSMLFDWVLPGMQKNSNKAHILKLRGTDGELMKLDKALVEARVNEKKFDYMERYGRMPRAEDLELIKSLEMEAIKSGDVRGLDIPDQFYKDLKIKLDIIITGEQIDKMAKFQALDKVLVTVASNPIILKDPQLKKIFYEILDSVGINPVDFEAQEDSGEALSLDQVITKQNATNQSRGAVKEPRETARLGGAPK